MGSNKLPREDYNFEATNLLTYNYNSYNVKITDAKSARTGKHFFLTDNSKSFELFFTKIGNKLFPDHVDIKLQIFDISSDFSGSLNAYSSDEETFKKYFNEKIELILLSQFKNESRSYMVEYSIVDSQMFIMMNNKHFNLKNYKPFFMEYDKALEKPNERVEELKIFLHNNVNKIIDEISRLD